jgi:glycosyltransferase involved in cell wall biosynthesis
VPTYNEAGHLERLTRALLSLSPPVAVLVVDDASPDGTGALAERLAAREPRLQVLHRTGRRGLGVALTEGLRRARERGFARVATMDGDLSHDPLGLPALLEALDVADLAIGSRYVSGGRIANWSLGRRLLSLSANIFVRLLFGLPLRDCTSNFRAYRGAVLDGIPWQRIRSSGYGFIVELLVWSRVGGARVAEVPIVFHDRAGGRSKLGLHEALQALRRLPRLRYELALRRGPGL